MRDIIEKKYSVLEIDTINRTAEKDPAGLVASSEEYYNSQVMAAAQKIAALPDCKFVLLCGPSASGKTTTAHKLRHRIVAQGVGARVVSMDNFFRGLDYYPKLPDGTPDMESFQAVDHGLLNECFETLFEKGEAMFPKFDFATQTRHLNCHPMTLGEHDVLIMEGIHALNPVILSNISRENVFRIYVSVRTKFISGEETILVPKDIRLMRRMVRDNNFRNYPPVSTLRSWVNVVAADRVNIDPYRDDVDIKIDNTIDYEVCIWHHMLSNMLASGEAGEYDEYPEIRRIFAGLKRFAEIDHGLIPKNSLLREFIGEDV